MSNGKVHIRVWKACKKPTFVLLAVLAILFLRWELLFIGYPGYLMGGYIDPDLDIVGLTETERRMIKHFWLIGYIFVAWWLFYAGLCQIFGAHRSWIAHWPGIGTAGRVIWLSIPIIGLIYAIANWQEYIIDTQKMINNYLFIAKPFYLGLFIADGLHLLGDTGNPLAMWFLNRLEKLGR